MEGLIDKLQNIRTCMLRFGASERYTFHNFVSIRCGETERMLYRLLRGERAIQFSELRIASLSGKRAIRFSEFRIEKCRVEHSVTGKMFSGAFRDRQNVEWSIP